MFHFATIPNVPEATLREMAFMFAFGNTFKTIGKHFNLDPNLCRMIAVDNWDKWQHYFNHAHELYRTEQAFQLIVQAITMMNQTKEPKGFVALLRVVLNFFGIPFRPKKAASPRPTKPAPTPQPPAPTPSFEDDEYEEYDDDDDEAWEKVLIATRDMTARMESLAPTLTDPEKKPLGEVLPTEPSTDEHELATSPTTPATLTIPPAPTRHQQILYALRHFGATTNPPDQ